MPTWNADYRFKFSTAHTPAKGSSRYSGYLLNILICNLILIYSPFFIHSCLSEVCMCSFSLTVKLSIILQYLNPKPEGKRPLGRPWHRWEDNIKMDLKEMV
jgi:hypothetical protein